MMSNRYEVKVVDTRTGKVLDNLPFSSFTLNATVDWTRHDSMSVTVPLLGTDKRREQVTGIAYEPWKRTLCLVRNGAAVWAGPLMTSSFDHTSVQFACGGLSQLLDRRLVTFAATDKLEQTLGQRDALVWLLARATSRAGIYSLPLTVPTSNGALPGTLRTYAGVDFPTVYESCKKVVEEDNAPDLRVDASLNGDQTQLTWTAVLGAPYLGRTDPAVAFDFPATMTKLTGDFDGSGMVTHGWVVGDGQGEDRSYAASRNALTDQGYPALEVVDRNNVSTRDLQVLESLADSYVTAGAVQAEGWNTDVHPEYPGMDGWSLGDNAKFRSASHWFLPDQEVTRRIVGYSLTQSSLSLETTRGFL